MREKIMFALKNSPQLTREQLLEIAWQELEETLAQLAREGLIKFEPEQPAKSHLDRFRLAT